MLLTRIQQDLYDFVDPDPDDVDGLVEFWYSANSNALSAALANANGLSFILNVASFESFESLSRKLFLVADTLVLRDTRKWTKEEEAYRSIPIPQDYKPGFLDDVIDELKELRPSPLTLLYQPRLVWSSKSKQLNNGFFAAYAGWSYNSIPPEFVKWITGPGRGYFETGRMVYAPFIPPLEMELEFMKQGVVVPEYFNATPCFHQQYNWLTDSAASALLSLKIPFLDGLDIGTISKVQNDNRDQFESFSRTLLDAISGVKAAFGTSEFVREVNYIQRNQIDAGLSDVSKTFDRIRASSSLRKQAILTGLVGLNAAIHLGASASGIATGVAAAGAAFIGDKIARMKEEGELKDKKAYFLWKLGQEQ